ncbi:uncharacterized protein [Pocillopora verrucosa]|uniref:uncharacterized protein n=1 Tax=Pocillopora verrucosa TaxID=203993 RepID=UPI00334091F2
MDRSYGTPRSVDAVDPTSSYDAWPTLPSTRSISETSSRSRCFCCRLRLSWTAVSVVEIALMIVTVVAYYFLPKNFLERMLPPGTQVTEVSEWMMRTVGSMVSVQIVLLIGGIGWGNAVTRKIIYWGMLTGDILLVAIQAAFVHSMSTWNAVNLSIVVLASTFALFRMITLICNPRWWLWVPEPNF